MALKPSQLSRRSLLQSCTAAAAAIAASPLTTVLAEENKEKSGSKMRFGLVTYLWGRDWPLPTLIGNCETTNVLGVELRTQHAHGVEAALNTEQRSEVRKRFADSRITLVGLGTNFEFHSPDPAEVKKNIDGAREYIKLSSDVGSTGVKVKPNTLPDSVPAEKTIEQIGKSLSELAAFGADLGQEIRLEVHGDKTQEIPTFKKIMDAAGHPNVRVCWNSNPQDLRGGGLEYNFSLLKDRFGHTAHVRELDDGAYPFQQLVNLFVKMDYAGWILLEASSKPADRVDALLRQRLLFEQMTAKARPAV